MPATKAYLDRVAMAALNAIENESEDTRGYVDKRIKQTEIHLIVESRRAHTGERAIALALLVTSTFRGKM